jgi:hypothetical protein
MVAAILGLFLLLSGVVVLALLPKVAGQQRPIIRAFGFFDLVSGVVIVVLAVVLRWP